MLSVDYVYIQGIPMLHTISGRSFHYRILEPVTNKVEPNKEDILNGLRRVSTYIETEKSTSHKSIEIMNSTA